jgi:hypothetical protein
MLGHPDTKARLIRLTAWAGALGVLATGADHLEEYSANHFSSVPTIGTLFLLNFIGSLVIAAGLLAPLGRLGHRLKGRIRRASAAGGISLAGLSLIGLWISETSSLFGFTDNGTRPAIVAAIAAEAFTIVALSAYVVLSRGRGWPAGRLLPSP